MQIPQGVVCQSAGAEGGPSKSEVVRARAQVSSCAVPQARRRLALESCAAYARAGDRPTFLTSSAPGMLRRRVE